MESRISASQIKKNMIISILAQIISLIVSFIMNLILPKYISEFQYAYWQTYLLYVGYVGILHFGLLDGIVLRYSQYDYEELDKPRIRSQFKSLLFINNLMAMIGIVIAGIYCNAEMKIVFIMAAVGIVTRNLFTYTSYTFQITNRINKYATMIISYRIFYGIVVCILLIGGVKNFFWFCLADLCSDLFGVFVGTFFNRGLYFGASLNLYDTLKELSLNISSGVMLTAANWSSQLLTGSARLIIQWHWDEMIFGKVSFSFSITNLFLTFVTAISVVLFPSLKRADPDKLPELYKQIRDGISPFLVCILICYYPGCWILNKWIPVYNQSLVYLGILLPIIVFTSKVSLLTNNYLKAFRKEKKMFVVNIISVCLAISAFAVSAYVFDNLKMLLICIVAVLMFRSIASEIEVMKILNIHGIKDFIIEILMTIVFVFSTVQFNLWQGFMIYLLAEIIYIYFYREHMKEYFYVIIKKIRN